MNSDEQVAKPQRNEDPGVLLKDCISLQYNLSTNKQDENELETVYRASLKWKREADKKDEIVASIVKETVLRIQTRK